MIDDSRNICEDLADNTERLIFYGSVIANSVALFVAFSAYLQESCFYTFTPSNYSWPFPVIPN